MIINSHVHCNPQSVCFFYNHYKLRNLISEMDSCGIDISLPSLNPKLDIFRCPNDCSYVCPFSDNVNNNMQNCVNCPSPKKHRTMIVDYHTHIALVCKTCNLIVYKTAQDPVRRYNIELIKSSRKLRDRIKPFVFLTVGSTAQKEIDFFEENFKGEFIGYKLHPWTNQASVENLHLNTKLPFLIHTGMRDLESSKNAIAFAKNHPNNSVVLAHAVQLSNEFLTTVSQMNNTYIDCCPSPFLYRNKSGSLLPNVTDFINSPSEIYEFALHYLSSEKILFGTDSPWGSSIDELNVISNLNITQEQKENILFKNAQNVYKIK